MMVLTLGVLLRGFFISRKPHPRCRSSKFVWHLEKQEVLLFQVHVVWRRITNASTYSGLRTVTGTEKKLKNNLLYNEYSIIFVNTNTQTNETFFKNLLHRQSKHYY